MLEGLFTAQKQLFCELVFFLRFKRGVTVREFQDEICCWLIRDVVNNLINY